MCYALRVAGRGFIRLAEVQKRGTGKVIFYDDYDHIVNYKFNMLVLKDYS